jgi:hypothetical protein
MSFLCDLNIVSNEMNILKIYKEEKYENNIITNCIINNWMH